MLNARIATGKKSVVNGSVIFHDGITRCIDSAMQIMTENDTRAIPKVDVTIIFGLNINDRLICYGKILFRIFCNYYRFVD